MTPKIWIPLIAAAALMSGCSERDNTRESTTPTADDTSTPGGATAPAPADSSATTPSTTTPSTTESSSVETVPSDSTQPANPPPQGGQ